MLTMHLIHPKHTFLASHFDYISADGKTLYEVKNLGHHQRKHYGENLSEQVSDRYRAQCMHELIVHQVENIELIVLFGGQELCRFPQVSQSLSKKRIYGLWLSSGRRCRPSSFNPADNGRRSAGRL
jgi:hypothetical protein